MLRANPSKRRQLSVRLPDIFWRDSPSGRAGLVVSFYACATPDCPCRDLELAAVPVGAWFAGLSVSKKMVTFMKHSGAQDAPASLGPVLRADLDLDTGELRIADSAPPELRDESALAWLRDEMDGELLDHLSHKLLRAKGFRPLSRLKVQGFRPGNMVFFDEAYLNGRSDTYLIGGRRHELADAYCVASDCTCTEMALMAQAEKQSLGRITVDLSSPTWLYRFEGSPVLAEIWTAFARRYPDPKPFQKRQRMMKEAGPELIANNLPAPSASVPEVGRNQPCPCGSGKKYKRCCLGK